jgi:hypothetical protein
MPPRKLIKTASDVSEVRALRAEIDANEQATRCRSTSFPGALGMQVGLLRCGEVKPLLRASRDLERLLRLLCRSSAGGQSADSRAAL